VLQRRGGDPDFLFFPLQLVHGNIHYADLKVLWDKVFCSFLEKCMAKPRRRRKVGSKKRRARWKIRHKIS
jgi:hypothetical protein